MAFRGGRGGWGGRGGGRGGAPMGPVARDDDGSILPTQSTGPPPLYPEHPLPELPTLGAKEQLLLLRRHDLLSYWRDSPFYLEAPKEAKSKGPADGEVERYSDKYKSKVEKKRAPLGSIMTLAADMFPEELSSAADKRRLTGKDSRVQRDYLQGQSKRRDAGLLRIETALQRESKAEAEGKEGEAKGGPDQEEEEVPVVEEDDDDYPEDDDYYQGEHFDDDEEYDYDEGGGGDDGPVY